MLDITDTGPLMILVFRAWTSSVFESLPPPFIVMSAVEIINDNCDVLKWHQRNDEIKQESARFVRLLQFRVWWQGDEGNWRRFHIFEKQAFPP